MSCVTGATLMSILPDYCSCLHTMCCLFQVSDFYPEVAFACHQSQRWQNLPHRPEAADILWLSQGPVALPSQRPSISVHFPVKSGQSKCLPLSSKIGSSWPWLGHSCYAYCSQNSLQELFVPKESLSKHRRKGLRSFQVMTTNLWGTEKVIIECVWGWKLLGLIFPGPWL